MLILSIGRINNKYFGVENGYRNYESTTTDAILKELLSLSELYQRLTALSEIVSNCDGKLPDIANEDQKELYNKYLESNPSEAELKQAVFGESFMLCGLSVCVSNSADIPRQDQYFSEEGLANYRTAISSIDSKREVGKPFQITNEVSELYNSLDSKKLKIVYPDLAILERELTSRGIYSLKIKEIQPDGSLRVTGHINITAENFVQPTQISQQQLDTLRFASTETATALPRFAPSNRPIVTSPQAIENKRFEPLEDNYYSKTLTEQHLKITGLAEILALPFVAGYNISSNLNDFRIPVGYSIRSSLNDAEQRSLKQGEPIRINLQNADGVEIQGFQVEIGGQKPSKKPQ